MTVFIHVWLFDGWHLYPVHLQLITPLKNVCFMTYTSLKVVVMYMTTSEFQLKSCVKMMHSALWPAANDRARSTESVV